MNIFDVLNRGNSSLGEVSFTAWLSFFLDPQETHGLSDTFLEQFLSSLSKMVIKNERLKALLEPGIEKAVMCIPELQLSDSEDNRQIADIVLKLGIIEKTDKGSQHITVKKDSMVNIIIEIKTKKHSIKKGQLNGYKSLIESESSQQDYNIICFLTPDDQIAGPFSEEYDSLVTTDNIDKAWIKWKNCFSVDEKNTEDNDVLAMIRNILMNESRGKIQPINTYALHTLKALANHIESHFEVNNKTKLRQLPAEHELLVEALGLPDKLSKLQKQIQQFLNQKYPHLEARTQISDEYKDRRYKRLYIECEESKNYIQIDCAISIREKPTVSIGISCVSNIKSSEAQELVLRSLEEKHSELSFKTSGRSYSRIDEHGSAVSIENVDEIHSRISDYLKVISDQTLFLNFNFSGEPK